MSSNKKSIPAALGERGGTIGLRVYTKRVHHVVIIHLLTYRLTVQPYLTAGQLLIKHLETRLREFSRENVQRYLICIREEY
jgi:hypothetical protein